MRRGMKFVHLQSGFFNEFHTGIELSELVMAATRICEDLDTVETHRDMRAVVVIVDKDIS